MFGCNPRGGRKAGGRRLPDRPLRRQGETRREIRGTGEREIPGMGSGQTARAFARHASDQAGEQGAGVNRMILIAASVILASTQIAVAGCVEFNKQTVALHGRVVPTQFYGPPNFGEYPKHDRRDIVAVLVLDRPIWTCDVPVNEVGHGGRYQARKLEMVFSEAPYGKQWNGKRVVATGTLYPWDNAIQYTPVLLWIKNVVAEGKQP